LRSLIRQIKPFDLDGARRQAVARSPDRWTSISSGVTPVRPTYISAVPRHSCLIAGNTGRETENSTHTGDYEMTTIRTFARFVALPIVSAGIIGGAALGLAGAANAATTPGPAPSISTTNGNFHAPSTYATPAYNPVAGIQAWRQYHRG
jgi:hypothetical protein